MSRNAYGTVRDGRQGDGGALTGSLSLRRAALLVAGLVVLATTALLALSLNGLSSASVLMQRMVDVGTLGRTGQTSENVLGALAIAQQQVPSDSENILGSLAITRSITPKGIHRSAIQAASMRLTNDAILFRQKANRLSAVERSLKLKEAKIKAMEAKERTKYLEALRAARKSARQPFSATAKSIVGMQAGDTRTSANEIGFGATRSATASRRGRRSASPYSGFISTKEAAAGGEAAEVARLVLSALEPQLQHQQSEISRIAKVVRRPSTSLNIQDYNMHNSVHGAEDPGKGAEPPLGEGAKAHRPDGLNKGVSWYSLPWQNPEAKGGPCSVAGECTQGQFHVRDPEYWRTQFRERYHQDHPATTLGAQVNYRSDLLSNPVGEAIIPESAIIGSGVFKDYIKELPSKDSVVAVIGSLQVLTNTTYTFCSPADDLSFLYVDDHRAITCRDVPEGDGERCGVLHLTEGRHVIKAALFGQTEAPSFNFTYSAAATEFKYVPLESADGWVARGYAAPAGAWAKFAGATCGSGREAVAIGDEVLLGELDDIVSPTDAYIHDQLTSGNYGYDHFGHLAPLSKENQEIMYGHDFPHHLHLIKGYRLHAPGRGGRGKKEWRSPLGDDQIDDDDREVPTKLSKGEFPGEDQDHFDHWKWNSDQNQELLNGRYWKHLKKDGFLDRYTPSNEAYLRQKGASHDRHPVHDLFVGSWNLGSDYGPAFPSAVPDLGHITDQRLTAHPVGRAAAPALDFDSPDHIKKNISDLPVKNFVVIGTGLVSINNTGDYLLCTQPSDPSMLFIDGAKVVYNDGKEEACESLHLASGTHPLRAVIYQADPAGKFSLTYSGPDTVKGGNATAEAVPARPSFTLSAFHTTADVWHDWVAAHNATAAAAAAWAEAHPEPWVRARQASQGPEWRNRVFVGTHESIEQHKGVVSNMVKDGAYF